MKKIIKHGMGLLLSLLLFAACSPQEENNYSLDVPNMVTAEQITFTQTPSSASKNVITFTNTTELSGLYLEEWDLGNGSTVKGKMVEGAYPYAGDYNVKLTIHTAIGSVTKSVVVHIADNDFSLINTPVYVNLTGGADDADGKTWVFDQYNNFTAEVKAATGSDIRGHIGLGPQGARNQEWWGAGAEEKASWKMYSFRFTFIQNGTQLKIHTSGEGYGRKASSASVGGFSVTGESGDDVFFPYGGGNYNFSINDAGTYPTITLSGNAFMGYYCGSQEYELIYQTDKVMALRVNNTVEKQDWVFIYCLQELNVAPPAVVKNPKAIPLFEDFESKTPSVVFVAEDMGPRYSTSYNNPAPVPLNESATVCLYQKTSAFYSNISHTAADYKFDLTTQNKIRVKVFIPSYNDYVTEHAIAGEWISNKKLLPQLAVKLQNSDHSSPWETQTEIVKANLEKDKWLELEFDFSAVSDRTDYDKIIIQFGAEGHAGPGIFFLDDFSFSE